MIKYTIIFCFLFLLNLYADKEIFLICNNTKSQMIDLEKNKISFFEKDNLITTIYVNKKLKKFYLGDDLRNNIELILISNNKEIIQFL
ncbi:hypothetical protein Q6A90_03545 [Aliarcobacter skirrowii]|uniref:hypothetical protein n=1 Tax=Aliarcobacter skirrowii TaxID=28200 RepID=UPI0029AE11CA|nr:hypothetical protein [Aliarcobacter skirrowii]MDX4061432.1 hypothetical protein [Aliarcobacter skirrowii]